MIGTEAEEAVLGACMSGTDSYRFAAEYVGPSDFTHPDLGELFAIFRDLTKEGIGINMVSTFEEAKRRGLKRVGAPEIASLLNTPENSGSVQHWASIVREDSLRRSLADILGQASQEVSEGRVQAGNILTDTVNKMNELRAGAGKQILESKLLGEVLEMSDEYSWVIPGLLEERDRLVVTAGEGAGKTTFIRQMAIASASGVNPITFEQIDPMKVLVVDAENSEKQWKRQSAGLARRGQWSGSADPAVNVRLSCSPRLDITTDKWLGAVHRLIDQHEPSLVCIGPLYRLIKGEVNGEEDMSKVLAALDTIRDRGIAMIVEAHAGHSKNASGTRELRPRGSSALMGWPEFGFGLMKSPEDERQVIVQRWRGDREERDWPVSFDKGGAWPWTDSKMPIERRRAAGEQSAA